MDFNRLPDHEIIEILLKLEARDVVSFGSTCKRFRGLSKSPVIWSCFDVGRLISDSRKGPSWAAEHLARVPQVSACRKMSCAGAGAPQVASLIEMLPFLVELCVAFPPRSLPLSLEVEQTTDAPVTSDEYKLIRAIANLSDLAVLTIQSCPNPACLERFVSLPKSLQRLEIRDLNGTIAPLARAAKCCPQLTCFKASGTHTVLLAEEVSSIWKNLCHLEEVEVLCLGGDLAPQALAASTCAANLRKITFGGLAWNMRAACSVIGRCCDALEEISIESSRLRGADIAALAPLRRLHSISLLLLKSGHESGFGFDADADEEDELDEGAFFRLEEGLAILGSAPEAAPFRRIELAHFWQDVSAFFSSGRCSKLREIELRSCTLPGPALEALVENAGDSLVIGQFVWCDELIPLLAKCKRLESLEIFACSSNSALEQLGASWNPEALRRVVIAGWIGDSGVRGILPALANVTDLDLDMQSLSDEVVREVISRCRALRALTLHQIKFARLSGELPPSIVSFRVPDDYQEVVYDSDDDLFGEYDDVC